MLTLSHIPTHPRSIRGDVRVSAVAGLVGIDLLIGRLASTILLLIGLILITG